jgi:hypothetical protein
MCTDRVSYWHRENTLHVGTDTVFLTMEFLYIYYVAE